MDHKQVFVSRLSQVTTITMMGYGKNNFVKNQFTSSKLQAKRAIIRLFLHIKHRNACVLMTDSEAFCYLLGLMKHMFLVFLGSMSECGRSIKNITA